MLGFTRKKYIRTFYLSKTAEKAPQYDLKLSYKINVERSLIISIILIIICFKLYPTYITSRFNNIKTSLSIIEVVDIPLVKKLEEPPPPPIKITEPITIVKIKEKTSDIINLKNEIKDENLKLNLSDNNGEILIVDSQLGDISSINFKRRNFGQSDINLNLDYSKSALILNDGSSLSLDLPQAKMKNKQKEKSLDLDTKALLPEAKTKKDVKTTQDSESTFEKIISLNKNQFLLKESESTIGTEEFKTWNRINSSLDRLNKDRYGELPNNVKRVSDGLAVSFSYNDGGQHDIFWSKGGKVIIRVTGEKPKSQLKELQKAYDALLRLIYKINDSAS